MAPSLASSLRNDTQVLGTSFKQSSSCEESQVRWTGRFYVFHFLFPFLKAKSLWKAFIALTIWLSAMVCLPQWAELVRGKHLA